MTDLARRMTALVRLNLHLAEIDEARARDAHRSAQRAVKEWEQLLQTWESEDLPDGPLFGGLKLPASETSAPAPSTPPTPARQSARHDKQLVVVREWWVYRKNTTDKVGAVNATTEPSALALAIEHHGPDVWVCRAGEEKEAPIVPAPQVAPAGFVNVLARGPLKCGAVISGPPGDVKITKEVNGETYHAIPTTTDGKQFPPCPKPTCRALIPCADDLPGGEYECLCRSCRFLVLRDANGLIRLELAGAPAVGAEQPGPHDHVSWLITCDFIVPLADGSTVGCTWHPDHQYAAGCGEPGRLELRGPVSPEGFRAMPVPASQRNEPLAEVARRRAQEAADVLARQVGEAKPKAPDWAAARKEDLASGVVKPRKKRKPAKGAASVPQQHPAGSEGGGE